MPDYGNPSYWDERYAANASEEHCYDWYQDFSSLKIHLAPFFSNLLTTTAAAFAGEPGSAERGGAERGGEVVDFEILIPGCGNSRLGSQLYEAGFKNVTNIDISAVVVSQMADLYAEQEEMEFTVMDARNMEFIPEHCFNLIIDKALFDALWCSENNLSDTQLLVKEMIRVLKPGGNYVIISHGLPETRLPQLRAALSFCGARIKRIYLPDGSIDEAEQQQQQGEGERANTVAVQIEVVPIPKPLLKDVVEQGGNQCHYLYAIHKLELPFS